MPVKKIGGGYQYGTTGKIYRGKEAKKKTIKQGQAIKAAQRRKKKR